MKFKENKENPNDPYVYCFIPNVKHTFFCKNSNNKNLWSCNCNYSAYTSTIWKKCSEVKSVGELFCFEGYIDHKFLYVTYEHVYGENVKRYKQWKKYNEELQRKNKFHELI